MHKETEKLNPSFSDTDFVRQLQGWRLTTAEITYRLPDYRDLLQIFVWQNYDLAPRFPQLTRFLDYWSHHLDGPLCSVRVACEGSVRPITFSHQDREWLCEGP